MTRVSGPYPFLKLKVNVDEAMAGRVMARLGGSRFDGSQKFPDAVRPVDFLVDDCLVEFKRIEEEPLSQPGRMVKVADFAMNQALSGKTPPKGKEVHLKGAAAREYWMRFLGIAVRRQLETAAKQIRSTRKFLNEPDRPGAVFLVNARALKRRSCLLDSKQMTRGTVHLVTRL
jgi:hypothetical protein